MSKEKLPLESESQEVGQHATLAFDIWCPTSWRTKQIEGDSDVGLDYIFFKFFETSDGLSIKEA